MIAPGSCCLSDRRDIAPPSYVATMPRTWSCPFGSRSDVLGEGQLLLGSHPMTEAMSIRTSEVPALVPRKQRVGCASGICVLGSKEDLAGHAQHLTSTSCAEQQKSYTASNRCMLGGSSGRISRRTQRISKIMACCVGETPLPHRARKPADRMLGRRVPRGAAHGRRGSENLQSMLFSPATRPSFRSLRTGKKRIAGTAQAGFKTHQMVRYAAH